MKAKGNLFAIFEIRSAEEVRLGYEIHVEIEPSETPPKLTLGEVELTQK